MKKLLFYFSFLMLAFNVQESVAQSPINFTVRGHVVDSNGLAQRNKPIYIRYSNDPGNQWDTVFTNPNGFYSHTKAGFTNWQSSLPSGVTRKIMLQGLYSAQPNSVLFLDSMIHQLDTIVPVDTSDFQTAYPKASVEGHLFNNQNYNAQLRLYGRTGSAGAAQLLSSMQIPAGLNNHAFGFGNIDADDYTVSLTISDPASPLNGVEYFYGGAIGINRAQWMISPLLGENPPYFTLNVPFSFPNHSRIAGDMLPVTAGDTVIVEAYLASDTTTVIASYRYTNLSITGQFNIQYGLSVPAPADYKVRAMLTPNSVHAADFIPTWNGNVSSAAQAMVLSCGGNQRVNLDIALIALAPSQGWLVGNVSGYVPSIAASDTLLLIALQQQGSALTPVDTLAVHDSLLMAGAYFQFRLPMFDTYTVLAILQGSQAANFLPTYHQMEAQWQQANMVAMNTNYHSANVSLLGANLGNMTGPGGINGTVMQPGSRTTGAAAGILVVLMDDQQQELGFTRTGNDGSYAFGDIPLGTYQLRIEYPGLPSALALVELNAANPTAAGIHFQIQAGGISTFVDENPLESSKIYPNPVADMLYIQLEEGVTAPLLVEIFDASGRKIMTQQFQAGQQHMQLSTEALPAGFYLLHLEQGDKQLHQKLMKNP